MFGEILNYLKIVKYETLVEIPFYYNIADSLLYLLKD